MKRLLLIPLLLLCAGFLGAPDRFMSVNNTSVPIPVATSIGTNTSTTGTTVAISVGSTLPVGTLVVIFAAERSSTIGGSVADSQSNSYTATTGQFNNNSGPAGWGRMWYSSITTQLTSSDSITFTKQGNNDTVAVTAFSATNIATSSPLDTSVTDHITGSGTTPSVSSGSPSQSGELFIACLSVQSGTPGYSQDTFHNWATPPNGAAVGAGLNAASVNGGSQVNSGTGTIVFSPTIGGAAYAAFTYGFKHL